jgi:protein SCO1
MPPRVTPIGPARGVARAVGTLSKAAQPPLCRRLLATAPRPQIRRPTTSTQPAAAAAPWQARRPLEQRRFKFKTVEEAKSRYRIGVRSLRISLSFPPSQSKGIGKPKVGGSFSLIDQDGQPFSSSDLLGRYSLVYFGFTHCPDICPEELDKMAAVFDLVEQKVGKGVLVPVFVTCDPARDPPPVLKAYLAEFHPAFVGLTGSYDAIKAMCKAYRVYFSTPTDVKPGQDYLVDHSIYFYLMDPEGDFVEALGRQHSPDEAAKIIVDHINDWKGPLLNKK